MLESLRKHLARIIIGLAVMLVFLGHAVVRFPLIERLEYIVYDTRLRFTMPGTVDSRIVILEIDEKSLAEREQGGEGHWPWPRNRLALLLDKLFEEYEVAIVGFDVVFAERDESSGIRELERLAREDLREVLQFQSALVKIKPQLEYDEIFAHKMKGRPVVLGYTFSSEEPDRAPKKGLLPGPLFNSDAFAANPIHAPSWTGYTANLEELQKNAASAGHFNPLPDIDGVMRRVPMLAEFNGAYYEPLSLAMLRVLFGSPPVKPITPDTAFLPQSYPGLEALQVGSFVIPVDDTASALVPYRGKQGSFRYYSVVDVLTGQIDSAELKGKIVLVGATAPALFDLRATPVGEVYPGVEVHANLIAGMLDGNIKQQPPYVQGAEFVLLLVSGLAMALVLPLLNARAATLTTLLVLATVLGTNVLVFEYGHLVLPLASGLVMILLLFTFNMAYGFLIEARGKRQIEGLFGQYVPPELVDKMAENPEQFSMAPSKKVLSVLFSDVRGFTSIAESLSPEDLSSYTNEFLTNMSLVIREKHRGTLDKYMGDEIMAFWGAPVEDADHARNAVLSALRMQIEAKALDEKFKERGWPSFKIGIGVNSGEVRVGNMGSEIRRAYTAMGDAVNIASRLQGITKQCGADIIVGEGTRKLLSGFVLRELGLARVKGRDEPVAIYEPLGPEGQVGQVMQDELKLWNQALRLYRGQQWDLAELQLLNLKKMALQIRLYDHFLERIAHFRAHPPGADWDGAWTFETK